MMVALCRMINAVGLTPRDRLPAHNRVRIFLTGRLPVSLEWTV
jgi:hypothetical protein